MSPNAVNADEAIELPSPGIRDKVAVEIKVRQRLPDLLQSVNLKYVKLGYHIVMSHALYLFMIPILLAVAAEIDRLGHRDLLQLWEHLQYNLVSVLMCSGALVFVATLYFMSRPRPVYLIDFACYKPEDSCKATMDIFIECSVQSQGFTDNSLEFQRKIIGRSGLGQETYLPHALTRFPPNVCMSEARLEAQQAMFGAIDELLVKTGVKAKDIAILVVNCSLFNPTPSLSSMVVNHYKMRGNVLSVNLGGMGCSAGVIAVDVARDLLQVHGESLALVVSTENLTMNWYNGNDRTKLVTNCLFRMGGAAVLLSNKRFGKRKAKYELQHTVRTHRGAEGKAYHCVQQEEDENGVVGITLSRELTEVAGDALKANITTVGPLVLPLSEQLLFFANLVAKKLLKWKIKAFIPDFKLAIEHFCIHAGGRAVLDEIQKNLQLTDWHLEPSRMALYRFGNTSSSSIWYELAYAEAKGRVRKGDRVWQIAFGSGFKCNSAVWRALRTVKTDRRYSPWSDCIDKMPVNVPMTHTFGPSCFPSNPKATLQNP